MKHTKLFVMILIASIFTQILTAEAQISMPDIQNTENSQEKLANNFPQITEKPFITFKEGLSTAWVTRLIKQTGRSNFVFKDFMLGAYFAIETQNMKPLDSIIRVAAYYPISHTFNDVPQAKKNMLNFAFDFTLLPLIKLNMWEILRFNIGTGPHFLYQMGDRWNYLGLGLAGYIATELPLARRWTILLNGYASIDYGNLGTNKHMEPYDLTWQYQLELGVRYSKKAVNKYSYIPQKSL